MTRDNYSLIILVYGSENIAKPSASNLISRAVLLTIESHFMIPSR